MGLSKQVIMRVISPVSGVILIITYLYPYLLSPLGLQVGKSCETCPGREDTTAKNAYLNPTIIIGFRVLGFRV